MKNFYLILTILLFAGQVFGQTNENPGAEALHAPGIPALKLEMPMHKKAAAAKLNETVIWGNNPGEGDFDGGLNDWTVESVSDSTALWYWDEDATTIGGFFLETTLASETAANGVMAFNADYLTTEGDGDPANLPPQPYPVHIGDLISPTIDMTDALDPQVLFTQAFRGLTGEGSVRGALFAYSLDDGATWSDFQAVNDDLEIRQYSDNPDYKRIDIPEVIGEAAVKIKFRFSGNFYFWMIDDVKIVERPPHNLAIPNFGVAIAEYYIAPPSQVYPVYFGGYVRNVGGQEQTNITLNATVDVYDLIGNLITDDAFSGSTGIESLEFGAADSLLLFDAADNFTPSSDDRMMYEIEYQLSQDSTDADPTDNTYISNFLIYDGYYSKARLDSNFEPNMSIAYRPEDYTAYEYGIHMYVPNGSTIKADSMQFAYASNESLEGTDITLILREWNDLDGDAVPTLTELEIVGFSSYSYTTDAGFDLITVPLLDAANQPGIALKDNTHYLLTGAYDGTDDVFMVVDESIEYEPSVDASIAYYLETGDSDLIRFADVLYVGEEWGIRGFDNSGVPSINVFTSNIAVAIEDPQGVPVQVSLHPNPASDFLNVVLTTEISNDDWKVSLSDVSGRSVLWNRTAAQADFPLQINVNELAEGTYMLTLENNGQIHTERFVKK